MCISQLESWKQWLHIPSAGLEEELFRAWQLAHALPNPVTLAPEHLLPALLPRVRLTGPEGVHRPSERAGFSPGEYPSVLPLHPHEKWGWSAVMLTDTLTKNAAVLRDAVTDGLGTFSSLPSLLPCIRHSHKHTCTPPPTHKRIYANCKRQTAIKLLASLRFFFFP